VSKRVKINDMALNDMAREDGQPLIHLTNEELMPLPAPLDAPSKDRDWKPLAEKTREQYECALDDTCAVNIPKPKSKEEERELVGKFLAGLEKLFIKEDNWTFLQPAAWWRLSSTATSS